MRLILPYWKCHAWSWVVLHDLPRHAKNQQDERSHVKILQRTCMNLLKNPCKIISCFCTWQELVWFWQDLDRNWHDSGKILPVNIFTRSCHDLGTMLTKSWAFFTYFMQHPFTPAVLQLKFVFQLHSTNWTESPLIGIRVQKFFNSCATENWVQIFFNSCENGTQNFGMSRSNPMPGRNNPAPWDHAGEKANKQKKKISEPSIPQTNTLS